MNRLPSLRWTAVVWALCAAIVLLPPIAICGCNTQGGGGDEGGTKCTYTCGPPGSPGLWAADGVCDDGGPGATTYSCPYGTDCLDCGVRP
jgi:hypothetical protein